MTSTSEINPAEHLHERRRARLEKLLQAAAHDYNLRFNFGIHDSFGADQIVMAGELEEIGVADYPLLKGHALHLLGHYLQPDSQEWAVAAQREENEGRPGFALLWHALEDARMENRLVERWPGTKKVFDALLLPNFGGSLLARSPLTVQIELGLYWGGRGYTGGRFSSAVRDTLNEGKDQIIRAANSATPADSFLAMITIYPIVEPLLLADRRRSEQISSDAGRQDGTSDGEENEPQGSSPLDALPPDSSPDIEIEDGFIAANVREIHREFPEWYRPGSAPWFERGIGDKQVHPTAVCTDRQTIVEPPEGDIEKYRPLRSEIESEVGFLAHRLTNLIREEIYLRFGGQYRSGTLNMAKLWKQRLSNFRLFQRPVSGENHTAAFTLMVDESASMNREDKYILATKAAILLGETLDLISVPLEIIGYTTAEYEARAALALGLTPAYQFRATRCSRLEHRIYKSFDEPFHRVRIRLSAIQPRKNNWDEESLWFAYTRLKDRPERNKIILILSDGQPNGDANHLIETVRKVQECKVVGIGIGADFVKEIYDNSIVVLDFRQMAGELLQILARELRYKS